MKTPTLSDRVDGVAWKYLTAVDCEPNRSNQHEIGGLVKAGFREYLGDPRSETFHFEAVFVYLNDREDNSLTHETRVSWYDSRRHASHRGPELRLYYDDNPVTNRMSEGNFLIIAKLTDGRLLIIVSEQESTTESQLRWFFDIEGVTDQFSGKTTKQFSGKELGFAALSICELLGIEGHEPDSELESVVLETFPNGFPSTIVFSTFARERSNVEPTDDKPDQVIIQWVNTEERMFRILERHLLKERIQGGFDDVDEFLRFSLSVQNRRKSRAGLSLENHLSEIFKRSKLPFTRGGITEQRSRPDFVFPGIEFYRDSGWPESRLVMLGAKTTCKERWRQVLSEASRIKWKHLFTLEPAISPHQTDEMQTNQLQLVVPSDIQASYTSAQQHWLISLGEFTELVAGL